jgi:uncharacterized Zn finger protein (UPF0148 family)
LEEKIYRVCENCGTVNLNKDYCHNCGEPINTVIKQKLKREAEAKEQEKLEKTEKKNRITLFFEKAKEHENLMIRYTARFFYSIWVAVIAIASFLALLFGYIAA